MRNKRGILGMAMVLFWTQITVVIILLIFILAAGTIKEFSGAKAGLQIYEESEVGLKNVESYSGAHINLTTAIFLIEGGKDIESSLSGVKYEK